MPRYTYSVIRFVPNPATGEFVNVGAIAGSEELRDWNVRYVSSQARARKLGERTVLASVFERMGDLEELCANATEEVDEGALAMTEKLLSRLSADWCNVVQLSAPTPIVAASADEALDTLFRHVVIDPEKERREYRNKWQAVSAMLAAYRGVGDEWAREHVRQRALVRPPHHPVEFDFVVANGRVVQLAQAWSFEIPTAEKIVKDVRAWAWAVGEIRKVGASMKDEDGSQIEVPRDVDIEVVYLPANHAAGEKAWTEAQAAFADLAVRPVNNNDVATVAARAERLLGRSAE